MATYITLCNFTDQGVKAIKESPARLDAAKQAFQAMGGEMKAFYLVPFISSPFFQSLRHA